MEHSEPQDKQGLLLDDQSFQEQQVRELRGKKTSRQRAYCLCISAGLNFCLVAALLFTFLLVRVRDPLVKIYSPANHVVEYKEVVWYDDIKHFSPYQMAPDDEVDDMWSELYHHTAATKVDSETARRLPIPPGVPGANGDGVVQLEMFHVLHCVNALRKTLFPERYPDYSVFQNGTRDDTQTAHHMHCIDRLRQYVMCAGNIGTNTYRWHAEATPPKWVVDLTLTAKCRDFDQIRAWAVANEYVDFDLFTPPLDSKLGW